MDFDGVMPCLQDSQDARCDACLAVLYWSAKFRAAPTFVEFTHE
jgi:hypothetical protein